MGPGERQPASRCDCGKPAIRNRLYWADQHRTALCPDCYARRKGIRLEPTDLERIVDAVAADEAITNLLRIEKELRD